MPCITARCGMASALARAKPSSRTRTNWPGSRRRSPFANLARNSSVPLAESSDGETKSSLPMRGSSEPSGRSTRTARLLPGRISAPARGSDSHVANCCDDGWKVTYTGSSSSIVVSRSAGPVTRAPSCNRARPTCPSISARIDAVVQILLRDIDDRLRRLELRARIVDVLLRHGVFGQQRLQSSDGSLCVVQSSDRAAIRSLVLHLIELVEDLPLRDDAAFVERPVDDDALDARTNLNATIRLDLRTQLVRLGDRRRSDRYDADLRRRRRGALLLRRRRGIFRTGCRDEHTKTHRSERCGSSALKSRHGATRLS